MSKVGLVNCMAGVANVPPGWTPDSRIDEDKVGTVVLYPDFIALFTPEEQAAILPSDDLGVQLWLLKGLGSTEVHLGNPQVIAGLTYLISLGLLTSDRKTAILSNTPP